MNEFTDGTKLPEAKPEALPKVEISLPPLPPPGDAALVAAAAAPVSPAVVPGQPSTGLKVVTAGLGLIQFLLALVLAGRSGQDVSYRIGAVIGSLAVWPLIFIGLFSLARGFRTPRTRLTICAVLWGLSCLGSISNLTSPRHPGPKRAPAPNSGAAAASEANPLAVDPLPVPEAAGQPFRSDVPEPAESGSPAFDFSRGSDKRLISLIDGVQKERYREVAAAYAHACVQRPQDAQLALERVRFVERFANSEEMEIKEAGPDLETAVAYLTTRFPDAPGTILYQLQRTNFDEVGAKAEKYEHQLAGWSAPERAEFLLLQARAANAASLPTTLAFVRESFRLNPTVEAGLLLARKAHTSKADAECLAALTHPVFADAEPWNKKQKLDLLLQIKETGPAADLYAELKADPKSVGLDSATATALGECGLVAQAREVFAGLGRNQWTREGNNRSRFVFELAHGTAAQAEAAYRTLRADGLNTDPYLRYRYELFRKAGTLGWDRDDLTGLFLVGVLGLCMLAAPLLLLAPAHYWSLWRERKGLKGGWPDPLWGLRQAWLALGVLLLLSLLAIWLLKPEEMRSWITGKEVEAEILSRPSLLSVQALNWLVLGLLLAGLVWRRQAWRLLGPGGWSAGRSIGTGVLVAFGLRLLVVLYLRIWPNAATGEIAALTQTNQMCLDLVNNFGAVGFLATIALFVPLLEETLFRGILLQALGKHVPFFWANAAQSLVFALVHENYLMLPFYFALGFACGELARRAGGLLPGIVLHSCNNALAGLAVISLQHLG